MIPRKYSVHGIRLAKVYILAIDHRGLITFANDYWEKLTESPVKNLLGKRVSDLFFPLKNGDSLNDFFRKLKLNGKSKKKIVKFEVRKNCLVFLQMNMRSLKSCGGEKKEILLIGRDITSHVQSKRQLVLERQELIERNKELTCLYGISQLTEKLELPVEDVLRTVLELIPPAFQYPDITSAKILLDGKALVTENYVSSLNFLAENIFIKGKNRGTLRIDYPEKPLPTTRAKPKFLPEETSLLRTLARQISLMIERKEAEDRKTLLEDQLRHADRLAKIGTLAAGVAHELNEPLAAILGFSQLAQKRVKPQSQVQDDLAKIDQGSLHAREVIKKLMLFSRQMPPQKRLLSLNALIVDGLFFLESRFSKDEIQVVQDLERNLPEIIGDPSQLNQVLVNLVINAAQSMPGGGTLILRTWSNNGCVFLSVSDTGIGMSKEVLQQVFLPFFTTKDVDQGAGLGLSVVHGIISVHGGKITVDSKLGVGSSFEISFPRKGPED